MQVDLDFDVFKALTLLKKSEEDSFSEVIRRLLSEAESGVDEAKPRGVFRVLGRRKRKAGKGDTEIGNETASIGNGVVETGNLAEAPGIWIANTYFPNGTKLRATYKGQSYYAEIEDSKWMADTGARRSSPSDAARAITGNNVNGWRFWHALLPGEEEWRRLDHYKQG